MNVGLIFYTKDAKELIIFAKQTALERSVTELEDIFNLSEEEKDEIMERVLTTISTPLEFADYVFLISEVTRAFTHQLVRHRVGVSFSQQSMRVVDQKEFNYMTPSNFSKNKDLQSIYNSTMHNINIGYEDLLKREARPQDARGILPTNIHTNILMKINLRALSDMLSVRLCYRVQGEFQDVAREMRKLVIGIHPWAARALEVHCVGKGICKFPRYKECPIKKRYPFLGGITEDLRQNIRERWINTTYEPQPEK